MAALRGFWDWLFPLCPPPQCHPSALLVPRPQAGPWGNPSLGLRRVSGVRSIQSTYLLIHKLY